MYEFSVEEIFEDIPGDDENVIMNIPDVILEQQGWKEGDTLKITANERGFLTVTKVNDAEG